MFLDNLIEYGNMFISCFYKKKVINLLSMGFWEGMRGILRFNSEFLWFIVVI